jgi:rare lipoprotein A
MRGALAALLCALALSAAAPVKPLPPIGTPSRQGLASWYGRAHEGRRAAGGGRFRRSALTAAHRTAPFGTHYLVAYGQRVVEVVITDRGPYVKRHGRYTRELDLSEAAARDLGLASAVVAQVTFRPVEEPAPELHLEQLLPSPPTSVAMLD